MQRDFLLHLTARTNSSKPQRSSIIEMTLFVLIFQLCVTNL